VIEIVFKTLTELEEYLKDARIKKARLLEDFSSIIFEKNGKEYTLEISPLDEMDFSLYLSRELSRREICGDFILKKTRRVIETSKDGLRMQKTLYTDTGVIKDFNVAVYMTFYFISAIPAELKVTLCREITDVELLQRYANENMGIKEKERARGVLYYGL